MEINQYNICVFPLLRSLTIRAMLKYLQDHIFGRATCYMNWHLGQSQKNYFTKETNQSFQSPNKAAAGLTIWAAWGIEGKLHCVTSQIAVLGRGKIPTKISPFVGHLACVCTGGAGMCGSCCTCCTNESYRRGAVCRSRKGNTEAFFLPKMHSACTRKTPAQALWEVKSHRGKA